MKTDTPTKPGSRFQALHQGIVKTYNVEGGINHVDGTNLPSYVEIVDIVKKIMHILFPGFYGTERIRRSNLEHWSGYLLDVIFQRLKMQIVRSICFENREDAPQNHMKEAEEIAYEVLEAIPAIRKILRTDVNAAYNGDPAAMSHEEVIMSYPAIQAIGLYRFAHELYKRKVPLITRMISEYAHAKTGVDIHPGAQIGENFFIDHGTGVVIGETCKIGKSVKIYQMVTLGALSFRKDKDGKLVKGLQRHPTIEDNVVLYAGCTILGGETVIGRDSVIGGNVWITESVPAGTIITFDVGKQEYRKFNKDFKVNFDFYQGFGI